MVRARPARYKGASNGSGFDDHGDWISVELQRGHVRRLAAVIAVLLSFWVWPGRGQTPARVLVDGRVERPATYSVTALAALPALEVGAASENGVTATFVGTPLWPLIEAARPIDGPEPGAHLQHTLLARGADGYVVAIAMGEVDPAVEGKPIIIAYKQDGVILAAPRLVVPGDRGAGRNVRALVSIDVQ